MPVPETASPTPTLVFTDAVPPITRLPARVWADLLEQVVDPPDPDNPIARVGPFDSKERAYRTASKLNRGRIAGSEPAGKFEAESRTLLGDGHTYVWVQLSPGWDPDSRTLRPDEEPQNGVHP